MSRESGRNDTRARIAHLAARLMAEDGIEDYALAKRKAARQAGLSDQRELPTNDEIAAALALHHSIFHPAEHRDRLRELREKAACAMRSLARFEPYLTGSVLDGRAGKYSGIKLQLYTDNVKAVEHYLIERGIAYRAGQTRLYSGPEMRTVPLYAIDGGDGVEIELTVLTRRDLRLPVKTSAEGKAIERARLEAVEQLLAED